MLEFNGALQEHLLFHGTSATDPSKAFDKPPIRPRPDSEGIERRYDSINGITGGSKVYITFENDHAYPAYLITYKDAI